MNTSIWQVLYKISYEPLKNEKLQQLSESGRWWVLGNKVSAICIFFLSYVKQYSKEEKKFFGLLAYVCMPCKVVTSKEKMIIEYEIFSPN